MKVNLKTTNEAENAAEIPVCHQRGQRTVNGIIGNTRRGIVIDKTLDPDSYNPVANKPVSTALAALAGKIDAALQKPTGLTKTKLVGVGASGQENIEIGDNLTLTNGKLAAAGGANVPPTLNLVDMSAETPTVRTSITEEEKQNIEKGLYNSVLYFDSSLGEIAVYSTYFPENAIYVEGQFLFSLSEIVPTGESVSIASSHVYSLGIGEKSANGTYPITIEHVLEVPFSDGLPVLDLSEYDSNTILTDDEITAIEDYGTKGFINIKLPQPFDSIPATLNKGFVVKKDGFNYKNSFIELSSTPVQYLLNDTLPIIALYDMRYIITDDKKLKMEYVALPKKSDLDTGDGFLTWDAKENKMVWKPLSTIIPVVEGTEAEPTAEEKEAGITKKYSIPTAQTSPFILHSNDIGYILVDIFAKPSVAYGGITSINRNNWALISGSDTTVYISTYHPSSFYSTDFFGYFPNDETTSVDITFPWTDRLSSPACVVSDADASRFFIRNDGSAWGRFQTPIIYCNDEKYRCWYIEVKTSDTTHKLATIKCKIVDIGGPTPTITFED